MPHQPLTLVLAASTTGSHPGPAFYAEWILVIGPSSAFPSTSSA